MALPVAARPAGSLTLPLAGAVLRTPVARVVARLGVRGPGIEALDDALRDLGAQAPLGGVQPAGVLVGDVITLLGSRPIKSADTFAEVESKLESRASVPLRLIRRGNPMFIGLKLQD